MAKNIQTVIDRNNNNNITIAAQVFSMSSPPVCFSGKGKPPGPMVIIALTFSLAIAVCQPGMAPAENMVILDR
jgi:hypothetical protein